MKQSKFNGVKGLSVLQKFFPLLLFLAVAWLCWLLARAFWLIVAPPTAPQLPPAPLQANTQTVPMGNGLDIFARAMPAQQNVPPPDVKIVGLTVANPQRYSFAILNFNGKVKSYKIDEMLDGSPFKLADVKKDHILLVDENRQTAKVDFGTPFLLDQRGQQQAKTNSGTVMLNNESLANQAQPTMPAPNAAMNNAPPTPTNINAISNPFNNPDMSENQNNQATPLDNAISGLQENPSNYLSQMGVTATGNGYMVTDGMPSGIKDRLGLQTGDRVISVNGQAVGQNPSQDSQILQQVKQSGQAQIQVQRGEQVITLNQSF